MTISLALRNSPKISVAMRHRVQFLANELGYRPNPLLSAHMSAVRMAKPLHYRATLAYISHFPEATHRTAGIRPSRIFQAASNRAAELGFRLEFFHLEKTAKDEERLGHILSNRGIPGVIIGQLVYPARLTTFPWERFAACAFGYSLEYPRIIRVTHDHYDGVFEIMNQLRLAGAQRPGLILDEITEARCHGFISSAFLRDQLNWPADSRLPVLTIKSPYGTSPGEDIRAWFSSHNPDAIFTTLWPHFIRDLIATLSLQVPKDILLARHVYLDEDSHISSMAEALEEIGAALVDNVVGQIHRNERGLPRAPHVIAFPGRWLEGITTKRANQNPATKLPAPRGLPACLP